MPLKTILVRTGITLTGVMSTTGCNKTRTVTLQPGPDEGKDTCFWTERPKLTLVYSKGIF